MFPDCLLQFLDTVINVLEVAQSVFIGKKWTKSLKCLVLVYKLKSYQFTAIKMGQSRLLPSWWTFYYW